MREINIAKEAGRAAGTRNTAGSEFRERKQEITVIAAGTIFFHCGTQRPNSLKQVCSKQFELTATATSVHNISAVQQQFGIWTSFSKLDVTADDFSMMWLLFFTFHFSHCSTFTLPPSLSLPTLQHLFFFFSLPNSTTLVCSPSYLQSVNTLSSSPAIDLISPLQSSQCTHANLAFDTTTSSRYSSMRPVESHVALCLWVHWAPVSVT